MIFTCSMLGITFCRALLMTNLFRLSSQIPNSRSFPLLRVATTVTSQLAHPQFQIYWLWTRTSRGLRSTESAAPRRRAETATIAMELSERVPWASASTDAHPRWLNTVGAAASWNLMHGHKKRGGGAAGGMLDNWFRCLWTRVISAGMSLCILCSSATN